MGDKSAGTLNYLTLSACAPSVARHVTSAQVTAIPAFRQLQRAFQGLDARKASYILAAGVNLAVVAYVGHKLYKSLTVQWETQSNLKRSASRLWKLATQVYCHLSFLFNIPVVSVVKPLRHAVLGLCTTCVPVQASFSSDIIDACPAMLWLMQGVEAAGRIPLELGESDEHGVFTYNSSTGQIHFRQSHMSYGPPTWEFSTDKVLWIPVCHVSMQ